MEKRLAYRRYWLFVFAQYYPDGGIHDLEATFDTIEQADEYVASKGLRARSLLDFIELVDSTTLETVKDY